VRSLDDRYVTLTLPEARWIVESRVIGEITDMMSRGNYRQFKAKYAIANRNPKYNKRSPITGHYRHDVGHAVDTFGTENVVPFSDGCCVHVSPFAAVHFGFLHGQEPYIGLSQNRMSRQDYLILVQAPDFDLMLTQIFPAFLEALEGYQVRSHFTSYLS
jgi:hypothetical protein